MNTLNLRNMSYHWVFCLAIASLMFIWAIFQHYFPHQVRSHVEKYTFFSPYMQLTFSEFTGERLMRSEAYDAIENYLSTTSSTQAGRLKADMVKNSKSLVISMDDYEEVEDEFQGVKIWWFLGKNAWKNQGFSFSPVTDEKRFYKLTFHKKNRELILGKYISHVMKEGKEIIVRNRQRKLYTNVGSRWSHAVFEHPTTFNTIAMDPKKKKEIMDDLVTFSKAEDFYTRIGRAWKREYLLYGPSGTGKSTMIAAMANLLGYDVYDLELTAVKDNTELRKLLIETTSKSVIVIKDIDCLLDLTAQRKPREEDDLEEEEEKERDPRKRFAKDDRESKTSKVTLSGLLNFIDGLWLAGGGERLIVFTTNHVEKLDPALIRKGRMDKHIEMSYCRFEAFKILARNYLGVESHPLFGTIGVLLEETDITPADVAEHFMPKDDSKDVDGCLKSLIHALRVAKAKAELKAEEEARQKKKELECKAGGKGRWKIDFWSLTEGDKEFLMTSERKQMELEEYFKCLFAMNIVFKFLLIVSGIPC